jgi:hypothetical protein
MFLFPLLIKISIILPRDYVLTMWHSWSTVGKQLFNASLALEIRRTRLNKI